MRELSILLCMSYEISTTNEFCGGFRYRGGIMSKALEQLRQIRHDFYINGEVDYDTISYFTNIERALKALEIIKTKGIYWGIDYQPYEEENDYRAWDNELYESVKLSKEEYDLLKEVLNDNIW